jgi:hypothetical protein
MPGINISQTRSDLNQGGCDKTGFLRKHGHVPTIITFFNVDHRNS